MDDIILFVFVWLCERASCSEMAFALARWYLFVWELAQLSVTAITESVRRGCLPNAILPMSFLSVEKFEKYSRLKSLRYSKW